MSIESRGAEMLLFLWPLSNQQLWGLVSVGAKMFAWGDGQEGGEDPTDQAMLFPHSHL